MEANIIKSVVFDGKVAYRIVRVDSVGDDAVLVSETQKIEGNNEHVSTVFIEESVTSQLEGSTFPECQKRDAYNASTIIENKLRSYFESIERRFMKIENHLTGISSSKTTTEPGNVNDNFYTDMLKNMLNDRKRVNREIIMSDLNKVVLYLEVVLALATSHTKSIP